MGLSSKNSITVQKVGEATSKLFELKEGDSFGLRGPFGKGFSLPSEGEKTLVIAGGVGAAPLAPYAEAARSEGSEVHTVLGARSADDLLFEERFAEAGEVYISTDDGSKGTKGFVTDVLKGLNLSVYDRIAVCGREIMMASVFRLLEDREVLEKSEFSLHRYFKCGIGVCGAWRSASKPEQSCGAGRAVLYAIKADTGAGLRCMYNLSTQEETHTNNTSIRGFDLYGDKIVWSDWDNEKPNVYMTFTWKISLQKYKLVSLKVEKHIILQSTVIE